MRMVSMWARVTWKQVMSAGGLEKQDYRRVLRRRWSRQLLARKAGADYLGVGAVFHTGTKKDASDVSFQTLKAICGAVQIPVVAIGGITADNMKHLAKRHLRCGSRERHFAEADIEQQPEIKRAAAETAAAEKKRTEKRNGLRRKRSEKKAG